jgi:aspartyl-tRNA synthetase
MGKNYWGKGRRYDFVLSEPSDKTRGQLSALRMELATRLGLRNPAEFAPLWVVFPLLVRRRKRKMACYAPSIYFQNQRTWLGYESW